MLCHSCATADYARISGNRFTYETEIVLVGVPKHPNEYVLTRWYVAEIFERATSDDMNWLLKTVGGIRTNLWRYKGGHRALGWKRPDELIDKLEERFPGSGDIFRGPMGQILMKRPVTQSQITSAIEALRDPHRMILLGHGYGVNTSGPGGTRSLDDVFAELEMFPEYRTIQAIVYMLAWADQIQNHDTWNATCGFYRHMIPHFIYADSIRHHEHVFDAVDAIAPLRIFTANVRRDRYRNWRRELPKVKKLRKQVGIEIMKSFESYPRVALISLPFVQPRKAE
jgi:hypothetical protein